MLTESLAFDPADPEAALRQIPNRKAVFALYGSDETGEPYLGVTPDLRRRLERLLRPAKGQTKRLLLVSRVRRIAWQLTGSEFESLLVQFSLLEEVYGAKALERMHLRTPAFIRFHGGNPYPRLTVTSRPSLGAPESQWAFGPFPSRASAEHYSDELLKLFLLRRCPENLDPNPSHPGCVYSEMKMCLAPCYQGCTDARYAEEAEAVRRFLSTRGESKLMQLREQRDRAAEHLEFEAAAALHAQYQRVEAVRTLAPELAGSFASLRVCILQASSQPDEVSIFLFEKGTIRGPASFSLLGMRIQNEQSGSSSLYAQPMSLEPVPEAEPKAVSQSAARVTRNVLEGRLETALETLSAQLLSPGPTSRQGHLALLARWYYRPQQKRQGEVFFPEGDEPTDGERLGKWPLTAILRGIGRVASATLRVPAAHRGQALSDRPDSDQPLPEQQASSTLTGTLGLSGN